MTYKNSKINKILFLVPSPKSKGGISNYYSVIQNNIPLPNEYFYRGVRKQDSVLNRFFSLCTILYDYLRFYFKIRNRKYQPIIINTSFGKTGFWRDYFFIHIIKYCKIKYIIFFRGIDNKVLDYIHERHLSRFKKSYFQSDGIIVFSKVLKEKLINLGYANRIFIETTIVDTKLLKDVSINTIYRNLTSKNFRILFLSRIEKSKGIYELLESFQIIKDKYPQITLHICGDGKELKTLKNHVSGNGSIFLRGFVSDRKKIDEYSNAQLFILPSYHEGLPNSVIEAMAFGLPVVTTPVGGIPDIFENEVNGILLDEITPEAIANAMEFYIKDPIKRLKTGIRNFNYAKERFYKEEVIGRLSKIINEIAHNSEI